jgi:Short C-terminal domain/SmpA / OmlA family
MNRYLITAIFACALLAGCATADRLNQIRIGMTKDQVVAIMGTPDSTSAQANMEYYTYYLLNESQYGRDQPYMIRFVDSKVESFGRFAQLFDAYNRPAVGTPQAGMASPQGAMMPFGPGMTAPVSIIRQRPVMDLASEIQKLKELRDSGVLTEDEFQKAKAKVLSDSK